MFPQYFWGFSYIGLLYYKLSITRQRIRFGVLCCCLTLRFMAVVPHLVQAVTQIKVVIVLLPFSILSRNKNTTSILVSIHRQSEE